MMDLLNPILLEPRGAVDRAQPNLAALDPELVCRGGDASETDALLELDFTRPRRTSPLRTESASTTIDSAAFALELPGRPYGE